jgi:hypothetical protein
VPEELQPRPVEFSKDFLAGTLERRTHTSDGDRVSWLSLKALSWDALLLRLLSSDDFVLLVGDAGIGKTYAMEKQLTIGDAGTDNLGRRVVRIDGSSGRFATVSLADWLGSLITTTAPVVVVMDEYHLLAPDVKEQFLLWCASRHYVKLIMVANRYEYSDLYLFAKHMLPVGAKAAASSETVMRHVVQCRGSVDNAIEKMVHAHIHKRVADASKLHDWLQSQAKDHLTPLPLSNHVPEVLLFSRMWLQSMSMLFGDGMLSMREIDDPHGILMRPLDCTGVHFKGDDQRTKAELEEKFKSQMLHMGDFAPVFVKAMTALYKHVERDLLRQWDSLVADPRAESVTVEQLLRRFNR